MRWCYHLRDILVIIILVMSNFDIDIGISNASFKVLALLVTCNSIWLGSKITFSLNYKWDSYALPHPPEKRFILCNCADGCGNSISRCKKLSDSQTLFTIVSCHKDLFSCNSTIFLHFHPGHLRIQGIVFVIPFCFAQN